MQYNWNRTVRRDNARGELATLLDRFWLGPKGNRFVAMAADEEGMVILSGTTRIAADVGRPMLYEFLDLDATSGSAFLAIRSSARAKP